MMQPGEQQFVDMMALRGWEFQMRADRKTGNAWTFTNTTAAYPGQLPKLESISVDTAMHFRKSGRSILVNLARERMIDYNGYPTQEMSAPTATCMSLNSFYAEIDDRCGTLATPKPPTPADPKRIWEAVRLAVG